jgi:hypothetical protein
LKNQGSQTIEEVYKSPKRNLREITLTRESNLNSEGKECETGHVKGR